MSDFYKTIMGRSFYEGTIPQIASTLANIAKDLARIADALENKNKWATVIDEEIAYYKEGSRLVVFTEPEVAKLLREIKHKCEN